MFSQLLMAAKFGVPVSPRAEGIGLCERAQHLSLSDCVAFSGTMRQRFIEYVDHLREHFEDPLRVRDGLCRASLASG